MKYYIAILLLAAVVSIPLDRIWLTSTGYCGEFIAGIIYSFCRFLVNKKPNGRFRRPMIWLPIVQCVHHRWTSQRPPLTNTKNGTSLTMKRLVATFVAFSKKWVCLPTTRASMWNVSWSSWVRAKMKLKSSQRSRNALIKIQTKIMLASGHSVVSTASRLPIWIWCKPVWRRTKSDMNLFWWYRISRFVSNSNQKNNNKRNNRNSLHRRTIATIEKRWNRATTIYSSEHTLTFIGLICTARNRHSTVIYYYCSITSI